MDSSSLAWSNQIKSLVYCPFCSQKTELKDTLQAVIYILIRYIYWQDWYLTLTKFEKRSVLVAMGLLELPDLRHTLVDVGTTLLCISGYNGLPGRTLLINLTHEIARRSERVDNVALSSAVSDEWWKGSFLVRSRDTKQDTWASQQR